MATVVGKRITIAFDEDHAAAMEELADELDGSFADAVRSALTHYIMLDRHAETIGETARDAIEKEKTNAQTVEIVRKRHPWSKTTLKSVSWYRSRMKSENPKILSEAQARELSRKPKK